MTKSPWILGIALLFTWLSSSHARAADAADAADAGAGTPAEARADDATHATPNGLAIVLGAGLHFVPLSGESFGGSGTTNGGSTPTQVAATGASLGLRHPMFATFDGRIEATIHPIYLAVVGAAGKGSVDGSSATPPSSVETTILGAEAGYEFVTPGPVIRIGESLAWRQVGASFADGTVGACEATGQATLGTGSTASTAGAPARCGPIVVTNDAVLTTRVDVRGTWHVAPSIFLGFGGYGAIDEVPFFGASVGLFAVAGFEAGGAARSTGPREAYPHR